MLGKFAPNKMIDHGRSQLCQLACFEDRMLGNYQGDMQPGAVDRGRLPQEGIIYVRMKDVWLLGDQHFGQPVRQIPKGVSTACIQDGDSVRFESFN